MTVPLAADYPFLDALGSILIFMALERVREAAASGGPAAEIEEARGLLESGAINQDEFERINVKALGSSRRSAPGAHDANVAGELVAADSIAPTAQSAFSPRSPVISG
jgi:hypothetical protein